MPVAKKAVKKVVTKGTGSPEVVLQSETTPRTPLVEVEFFEGKKVISSVTTTANGINVRDITVEGGITYRVNA